MTFMEIIKHCTKLESKIHNEIPATTIFKVCIHVWQVVVAQFAEQHGLALKRVRSICHFVLLKVTLAHLLHSNQPLSKGKILRQVDHPLSPTETLFEIVK